MLRSLNEKIKKFTLWDLKLAQGAAMFVALILVKLLEPVLNVYNINIWWFVLLAVVCGIKPMYTAFAEK